MPYALDISRLRIQYLVQYLLRQGGHALVGGKEVFQLVGAWGRNLKMSHRSGLLWVNLSGTNSNIADGGGFFRPAYFTAR